MEIREVSEIQGTVDWKKEKEKGVSFAMLRVGYGNGVTDLQFRKNAQGCNDMGIPCGAYWFSYAWTPEMAEREAEHCVGMLEEYEIAGPVCIDLEETSLRYARSRGEEISGETAAEIIERFGKRIEASGYLPGYYSKRTGICDLEQICAEYKKEKRRNPGI